MVLEQSSINFVICKGITPIYAAKDYKLAPKMHVFS